MEHEAESVTGYQTPRVSAEFEDLLQQIHKKRELIAKQLESSRRRRLLAATEELNCNNGSIIAERTTLPATANNGCDSARLSGRLSARTAEDLSEELTRACELLRQRERDLLEASRLGQHLVSRLQALEDEHEELVKQKDGQIKQLEQELRGLHDDYNSLNKRVKDGQGEKQAMRAQLRNVEGELLAKESEMRRLLEEQDHMREATVDPLRAQLNQLMAEVDRYRMEMTALAATAKEESGEKRVQVSAWPITGDESHRSGGSSTRVRDWNPSPAKASTVATTNAATVATSAVEEEGPENDDEFNYSDLQGLNEQLLQQMAAMRKDLLQTEKVSAPNRFTNTNTAVRRPLPTQRFPAPAAEIYGRRRRACLYWELRPFPPCRPTGPGTRYAAFTHGFRGQWRSRHT
eukprot:TRINITY_DN5407_c0_g1_i2.p1 TRINITY_DN5407_c0_g1~~TRINITY_DN5407_c0_g1_i2.p1  ORF type:complete len:405 (-),score=71.84 TRINITY_DN5407_c0_g1_i2:171-1385(-)